VEREGLGVDPVELDSADLDDVAPPIVYKLTGAFLYDDPIIFLDVVKELRQLRQREPRGAANPQNDLDFAIEGGLEASDGVDDGLDTVLDVRVGEVDVILELDVDVDQAAG
tara:strand:- start:16699 stop:17031 length:333 start_codon:yes stop_codon:yes gene_type:complete